MTEPASEAALVAELRRRRRLARRRHRVAALVYLAVGAAFGTCVYLARTRLSVFVRSHTWPLFVGLVALAVGLYVLATRYEADARREDEQASEIEERLERLRKNDK